MAQSGVSSGDSWCELEKICLLLSLGEHVYRGPLHPVDHGTMSSTVPSCARCLLGLAISGRRAQSLSVDSSDSPRVLSGLVSRSVMLCSQAHACSGLLILLGEESFIIT